MSALEDAADELTRFVEAVSSMAARDSVYSHDYARKLAEPVIAAILIAVSNASKIDLELIRLRGYEQAVMQEQINRQKREGRSSEQPGGCGGEA